jgi:exo-1,4-beta-D-glucosaminidase
MVVAPFLVLAALLCGPCVGADPTTVTSVSPPSRHAVRLGWSMQSSAVLASSTGRGELISLPSYDARTWYCLATFPATVLAGLMQHDEYPGLFESTTMQNIDPSRFDPSWWYRTEIPIPEVDLSEGTAVTLTFKGINYRANIFVNGDLVAGNDTIQGTFRAFEIDITTQVATARGAGTSIVVAVEVFRPYDVGLDKNLTCRGRPDEDCLDLAISWVDWAPTPPDVNMGLWRDVELAVTGPVAVRHPQVATTLLPSGDASLEVLVALRNLATTSVAGVVAMSIEGSSGVVASCSSPITVKANGVMSHVWSTTDCPALIVANPPLWWPWQMGAPTLLNLTVTFAPTDTSVMGGRLDERVGLRQVTKTIDENRNALFRVNGKRILIRGGGWAPDLLQRMTPERHAQELAYVRHLGLNAVRLEGKLQDDDLFQQVC